MECCAPLKEVLICCGDRRNLLREFQGSFFDKEAFDFDNGADQTQYSAGAHEIKMERERETHKEGKRKRKRKRDRRQIGATEHHAQSGLKDDRRTSTIQNHDTLWLEL